MIGEAEALQRILGSLRSLPPRTVPLVEALDSFCARDLVAGVSLPPFDNSSMDGYAVLAESVQPGARARIVGEQPAGLDRGLTLRRGEAIRILTGAPIPAGADAVIMQEDTVTKDENIVFQSTVERGENIRRRGGDVTEGQKIASAGDRLNPQRLALLASQGLGQVEIGGRARAAIISTGDELARAGEKLQPGQIYESNAILLQALLQRCGAEVALVRHCADRAADTEAALREGTACDLMLVTGGVSVGSRDLVKPALRAIGASLDLWRVAVKPGKPFLFGRAGECAVFGLPGNPVSAFVTFLLFVRPALLTLMGANEEARSLRTFWADLNEEITNPSDRRHYMRGILANGSFTPAGRQESHALFGLSRANALLPVDPGARFPAGARVPVLTWE